MKKLLLRYITLATSTCLAFNAYAQEYYDATNTPRQWYYNNLEGATSATPSTYFASGASALTGTAITMGTGASSNALTKSLLSSGNSTVGNIRWNFLKNQATETNQSMNTAPWEWEFDYRNRTGGATDDPDAGGMAAGKNSWRYWLQTYTASGTTCGLYVTHYNGSLQIRRKYDAASTQYQTLYTVPLANNTDTYQIRLVRSVTGYFNVYILDRTTGVLTTSLNLNLNYYSTYNLSYIDCTSTTAGRFEWDNFNFYQVRVDYVPITGDSGLTTAIYPGIVDAIPYAVKVNVRGDVQMGRYSLNMSTNGGQPLFTSGSIYKTTTFPIAKATGTFLANFGSVNTSNTNYADMPSSEYYYDPGNTDGTTDNVINYFFVFQGRNPFFSTAPSSVTFSVSTVNTDTYSSFFQSVSPYGTGSSSSTSSSVTVGDLWDWTGANASWTSTANAWKKNGTVTTSNPQSSTDIVRIGVVAYTGANQPTVNSTRSIGQLIFGTNNSPSITVAAGLTINDDLIFNSSSTTTLTLSSVGVTVIDDVIINSSATVNINGTNPLTIGGNFTNGTSATFTSTANTVTFSGTTAQTITNSNTSTSPTVKFKNLTFSGNNTKTFASGGYYSVASTGLLTLSGSSTILSIPTTTHLQLLASTTVPLEYAQIATIPTGCAIKGNIDYQVYFQGGSLSYRNYRSMGAPVYNNTTTYSSTNGSYKLADLKNTFIITGSNGTTNGFDASTNNGATLRTYNSSTDTYSFITSLNTTPTIATGTGFYMYFRGDRVNKPAATAADPFGSKTNKLLGSGGNTYATPESVLMTYTGIPNQGSDAITFGTDDSKYYFISNPYAATLNGSDIIQSTQFTASLFGFTYTSYYVTTGFWTWNPTLGTYAFYDWDTPTSSTNGGKQYIVPGQGFFVRASTNSAVPFLGINGSPHVLTITESMKSTSNSNGAVRLLSSSGITTSLEPPVFRLEFKKNNIIADEIGIVLKAGSKDSLDVYDAPHMSGDYMNLTTITPDNKYLAIDKRPFKGLKTVIPLFINVATDSIYAFKKTYTSTAMSNYKVTLYDSLLNNSVDIVHNDYKFNISRANAATYGGKRFKLIIEAAPAPVTYFDFGGKLTDNKKGLLTWQTNIYREGTTYQLQRSQDNVTFNDVSTARTGVESTPKNTFEVLDNDIQTGENYYRLVQTDVFNNKTISNTVMLNVSTDLGPVDIKNGFKLYPNPVTTTLSIISDKTYGKVTMRIYDSMSSVLSTKTFSEMTALQPISDSVSQLKMGVYFVELRDNNNNVLTTLKFLKQ